MTVKTALSMLGIAGLSTLLFGFGPERQASITDATVAVQNAPAETQTVSGCIRSGADPGEFFIKAANSDDMVQVVSSEDLSAHVGKHVQLTGTMENVGGKKVFRASRIEVLAESCPTS